MKNTILNLEENKKVMVIDELIYKNKKYCFVVQLDDEGNLIEKNVFILEINIENNELVASKVTDFETSSIVSNMFIARQMENKNS